MTENRVYICHKPQTAQYRCFCEEKEEASYCEGCRFWYPELVGVSVYGGYLDKNDVLDIFMEEIEDA